MQVSSPTTEAKGPQAMSRYVPDPASAGCLRGEAYLVWDRRVELGRRIRSPDPRDRLPVHRPEERIAGNEIPRGHTGDG